MANVVNPPELFFYSQTGEDSDGEDVGTPTAGQKRPLDLEGAPERKTGGRRKIPIEFIEDKSRRHITFSKRKAGIMKKAYELSTLTGTQVLLLVASETGHVYTFATPKLQPLITKPEGKNVIQACLNAPDVPAYPTEPLYEPAPLPHPYLPHAVDQTAPPIDMTYPGIPPFPGHHQVHP